jgi:hypothetical protein
MPKRPAAFICLATAATIAAFASTPGAAPARPLETGVFDGETFMLGDARAFNRVRAAGATRVRIAVGWSGIAPGLRPATGDPTDPEDPDYDYSWRSLDTAVRQATRADLEPVLSISGTPRWARRDPSCTSGDICAPDAGEFADFAKAAARRYSGHFDGIPPVRYWQAWNEANIHPFLVPQFDPGGTPVSPDIYREMLNRFAAAVKAVDDENLVITSGLAPLTRPGSLGPLDFMRRLLCMADSGDQPVCAGKARFDIWSTHPYTPGSPRRQGSDPDDAALGDLPEMTRLLRAAERAERIESEFIHVPFWVTEFSWDTNGPDPGGVPIRRHARWTAEALYRMWKAGVRSVFWFLLRDQPGNGAPPQIFQSGLYFRGDSLVEDRPKLSIRAFRFPFVALPEAGWIRVWGRTPDSLPGIVHVQMLGESGRWRTVARLLADADGIFSKRTNLPRRARLRALVRNTTSVPFVVKRTRDMFQPPFGKTD